MDELEPKNKLLPLAETEEGIADRIFTIRGVQVMLDSDIAALFEIPVRRINEQMKRNPDRFPEDFCFKLTKEEILRSQFATSSSWGGRRYLPYVYTEQGIRHHLVHETRYCKGFSSTAQNTPMKNSKTLR